jgi:hypothetical protein
MKDTLRLCLPVLFIGFYSCGAVARPPEAPGNEFWRRIRQIEMKVGQGREALLEAWPVSAELQKIERSGQLSSLEGGVVAFTPDVIITNSEVRLNGDVPVLASFEIDGRCITVKELKQYYPNVSITDIPHSASPEDKTYWSTNAYHGRIAFGFAQKRPRCLASAVFRPKASPIP